MLADSAVDPAAGALFLDYAKAFHGRRQLFWSGNFKHILDILDKSDHVVNEEPEFADQVEIAVVPKHLWRVVIDRELRAELLDVAQQGGALYVEYWLVALELQTRMAKVNQSFENNLARGPNQHEQ